VFFFRTGIIAALLLALAAPVGPAWAQQAWTQYYTPRAYPPPQASPNQPVPLDPDREIYDTAAPRDATGSTRIDSRNGDSRNMAALPPEVRPETGPRKELPPQFRRRLVDYYTKEPAGTIIVDTPNTYLYLVLGQGKALRYGIGVGREGFTWSGAEKISRKAEWPDWNPPEQMIERQPYLPRFMAGGDGNPLGARALYLGDTIYRIHGTNQPSTIGTFVSSGCIRLTNEDITDLHSRVKVGTRVVVLPGRDQANAVTTGLGSSRATASRDKPTGSPSSSDLPAKRFTPAEIAAKLRAVDASVAQGQPLADAARAAGISKPTYHRWRQELGDQKSEPAKRPAEPSQDTPKRIVEGEAGAVRDTAPRSKGNPDSSAFEE
jgi:lipoprotein-anchoring transpeptidase ErfK/SrfK/transposase-like protein